MTTIFRSVGWDARQLDGGYKAYRRQVVADLETLPRQFHYRVLCGATGSAKSRILQAIGALGEQIVDLEALASLPARSTLKPKAGRSVVCRCRTP
jgi:tRNA 2-selenouridine synthase